MPALPSASGMARMIACPAAYALPAVEAAQSADAAAGTGVHTYLERLVDGYPSEDALACVSNADARVLCPKIDRRKVPVGAESEISWAYDVATGRARRIAPASHREYADLAPTEIPGTCDVVHGGLVLDWKTARWDFDAEACRPQLEFYALCHARERGLTEATYRIAVIADDGAIGGPPDVLLDFEDLAAVAARVRRAWDRVQVLRAAREARELAGAAWTPDVAEGPHCKWCSAAPHCPAKRAAVASVLGVDLAALAPGDVGRAYATAKDAEAAVERVRDAAKLFIEAYGPVATGDGRLVRLDGNGALRFKRVAA